VVKSRVKNKNPIVAKDIHSSFSSNNVFINDQLTAENRKILWLGKQVSNKYKYNYIWANGGDIFLKKEEGHFGTRIRNISQLRAIDVEKEIAQLRNTS